MGETLVLVSCKDRAQARRIATALVKERLAACASVVPGVESVYAWKGRVERAREALLLIKSRRSLFRRLAARVKELHTYEVPELLALPVAAGEAAYLRWLRESVR
jgi:periplasmic divalent cation tolerance protein